MASTVGYVGTVQAKTSGVSRLWFSLTKKPKDADWVKIGSVRAWFTMNMETGDRPVHMAQLTLLMEALRSGLQVQVVHDGAEDFKHSKSNDSFEVQSIRILRSGMKF